MTRDDLLARISIDPKVCFAKPCIRGHRIWVSLVLDFLADGMTVDEILEEYPTLEAAARRETLEEVGVHLEPDTLIGRLHDVYGGRLADFSMAVSPYVYHCEYDGPLTPNYEVADTVWVPVSFLGDPANLEDYYFPLDPLKRAFPAFQYGPYTIWGLTYRIIASLMELYDVNLPHEVPLTDVE